MKSFIIESLVSMIKNAHWAAEAVSKRSTKQMHDWSIGNSAVQVLINNSHCAMKVLTLSDSPPNLFGKLLWLLCNTGCTAGVAIGDGPTVVWAAPNSASVLCSSWSTIADKLHNWFSIPSWHHRTVSNDALSAAAPAYGLDAVWVNKATE